MKIILLFLLINLISCSQQEKDLQLVNQAYDSFDAGEYEQTIIYADQLLKGQAIDCAPLTLKGRALFQLEKEQEALDNLSKAIKLNPYCSDAYKYRALLYNHLNQVDLAIRDMDIAIKAYPNDPQLLVFQGGFFFKRKAFEKAVKSHSKALEIASSDYSALIGRANAYKSMRNFEKAFEDLEKAIGINPENMVAYEIRAFILTEIEDHENAIADFKKVIALHATDTIFSDKYLAYSYNNLGFALHKTGKNDLALENIEKSMGIEPNNPYAYKNRALVYLDLGDNSGACTDLLKARELGYKKLYGDEVEELIKTNCEN